MRIQADTAHLRNSLTTPQAPSDLILKRNPSVGIKTEVVSSSPSQGRPAEGLYRSYPSQNISPYHRAIRAYQEASRFENNPTVPLHQQGNLLGEDLRSNEAALTEILRDEPQNSAAWYDLGLVYALRGNREKVSAVYQILQRLDLDKAEGFSMSVGLHEKQLLDVG